MKKYKVHELDTEMDDWTTDALNPMEAAELYAEDVGENHLIVIVTAPDNSVSKFKVEAVTEFRVTKLQS
jgi:hypothetical protein